LTDISALPHRAALVFAELSDNPLSSHAPVADLDSIERLFLDGTGMEDADMVHLEELDALDYLHLGDNAITDISSLSSLTNLGSVLLDDNPLSETSCCTHVPALETAGVDVSVGSACDAYTC
jgi:internalin A